MALCVLGSVALVPVRAAAAVIVQRSVPSDRELREGDIVPANSVNNTVARIGYNADATNAGRRFVTLIPLPTLATGETISAVDFDVRLFSVTSNDPDFAVDVVGLGTRPQNVGDPAATVRGSDYSAAGTLVVDDLIPDNPSNVPGQYNASNTAGGSAALLAYVQSIYAAGGVGYDPEASNTFLLLRLEQSPEGTPGTAPTGGRGYNIVTGNAALAVDRPTLQLTVVPEPGSVGLFGAVVAFAFLRRRHGVGFLASYHREREAVCPASAKRSHSSSCSSSSASSRS